MSAQARDTSESVPPTPEARVPRTVIAWSPLTRRSSGAFIGRVTVAGSSESRQSLGETGRSPWLSVRTQRKSCEPVPGARPWCRFEMASWKRRDILLRLLVGVFGYNQPTPGVGAVSN
jgi:hypothetical protein